LHDGERDEGSDWLVVIVSVPATPSRYRVAVWRELRRVGAIPLGQGVWGMPNLPAFEQRVADIVELVAQGGGDALLLDSRGHSARDAEQLRSAFARARAEEWTEFLNECGHFLDEIEKEIAKDKLTMAELDEEEQSLERLRRWHGEITRRDAFAVAAGSEASDRLTECAARLEDYAQLVYERSGQGAS